MHLLKHHCHKKQVGKTHGQCLAHAPCKIAHMPNPTLALADADIANMERATLDAVAPPATGAIENWLLPFDTSTIGRAKSAVPLRHHQLDAAQVATIEALYAARGLQAAFRVADVPGLANIHAELHQRGVLSDAEFARKKAELLDRM